MLATAQSVVARILALRPARVFARYTQKNGAILAGGLSLTALYSIFAAIYVGFAIFGFFIQSDAQLRDTVVTTLTSTVPGLIDTGNGDGAINLDALFRSRALGWSSIVAFVILLSTALNWLGSARVAVRMVFDLPADKSFFLLLKLRDFGLVVALALVLLLTTTLSVASTSALQIIFDALGIDSTSNLAILSARMLGLVIVLVLNTTTLALLIRVFVNLRLPIRRLLSGVLIGGVALTVLNALGSTIVGSATRHPLLASFAIILGLLIWLGLVCQVVLLSATWVAVDLADHGHELNEQTGARRIRPPKRLSRRTRAPLLKVAGRR